MYTFREATQKDKEYILNANKEINILSGLNDSTFEQNIDSDLFEKKICKSLVIEENGILIGFILYSYIYWVNCGKGLYLSNVYVDKSQRKKGIFKLMLKELEKKEEDCKFITNLVGNENTVMMNSLKKISFKNSELITYYKKIN